jgi:subtilisin family serine protease
VDSGLGKGSVIECMADAAATQEASQCRVNRRRRAVLGWYSADEQHRCTRRKYDAAEKKEVYETGCRAKEDAMQGPGDVRARRLAARRVAFATLEQYAIINRQETAVSDARQTGRNTLITTWGVLCFILSGFGVTVAAAATDPDPWVRHVRGQDLPLELDRGRLALFQDDPQQPQAKTNAAARVGIPSSAVTEHPIQGWATVQTQPAFHSDAGVQILLASLEQDPGIEFVSPVFFDRFGGPLIVSQNLLVRFDPAVTADQAETTLESVGAGQIMDENWASMPGTYRLRSTARNGLAVLATANALARRPDVLWAEPDWIFTGRSSQVIPNDPQFGQQWGLHNTGQAGGTPDIDMDGPEAWDVTLGDASIQVAVIDTGVQLNHPDLNALPGTDTTSDASTDGSPVNSCDNHGTWVAGCVSAVINNGIGITGIAPNCVVRAVRPFISITPFCDNSWTSAASWTVNALNWAELNGVRVSNNSNFYGFTSLAIEAKYDETRTNGMVHFASSGNDGYLSINYPASHVTVNAVGAVNRNGNLAGFSDSGVGQAFSGPGVAIRSTDRTGFLGGSPGNYTTVSGTSFASPYAAGVAALVLSVDAGLGAADVETILADTALDLGAAGYDTTFGWGLVNAADAVQAAGGPIVASMDIKPGSCPNPLNRKSQGYLPVALVGSMSLDTATVDFSSVTISRADGVGGAQSPHEGPPGPHSVFEDVTSPFDGDGCDCDVLASDGIVDLSMNFDVPDLVANLQLDGLPAWADVELVLRGTLFDGSEFEATDCILLVSKNDPGGGVFGPPQRPR